VDFEFTEEQQMLKQHVRDFLAKEIAPIVDERDRRGPLTNAEVKGYIKRLMPFGYYNGFLPEKYGGMGISAITNGILHEELNYTWSSLAAVIAMSAIAPQALLLCSDELRNRLLPSVAAGDLIGCSAITEPNAGSDATAIETAAVLDGNEYVINGTKTWISNGTISDICILLAVTDKSLGPLGISTILVEKKVSPWETRELHKLGWRAFPTGELYFTDCRVPKRNEIGATDSGYRSMMKQLEGARAGMAIMATGVSQAAVDASIQYARERNQFGKPIGSFQMIQGMIADMIADTEATRLLAYRALYRIDKGLRARLESSLAKAFGCEAAVRVTSMAVQIHGAMGYSEEYRVERYFRDARMLTIPDGTTQIQKLIVGREAIGIRAFV